MRIMTCVQDSQDKVDPQHLIGISSNSNTTTFIANLLHLKQKKKKENQLQHYHLVILEEKGMVLRIDLPLMRNLKLLHLHPLKWSSSNKCSSSSSSIQMFSEYMKKCMDRLILSNSNGNNLSKDDLKSSSLNSSNNSLKEDLNNLLHGVSRIHSLNLSSRGNLHHRDSQNKERMECKDSNSIKHRPNISSINRIHMIVIHPINIRVATINNSSSINRIHTNIHSLISAEDITLEVLIMVVVL